MIPRVWLISRMDHAVHLATYLWSRGHLARWDSFVRLNQASIKRMSMGIPPFAKVLVRRAGNRLVAGDLPTKGSHVLPELTGTVLRRFGSGKWNYWQDTLLDRLARWNGPREVEVVHGWSNYSLESMRWASRRGILTILEMYFTHPKTRQRQVQEEFLECGIQYTPADALLIDQIETSIAEADAIIVPSAIVRESLLENGVSKDRVAVVPFGVDTSLFRPAEDPRDGIDGFEVLYIGSISVEKGVRILLEGFREFKTRFDMENVRLRLIGRVSANAHRFLARHAGEYTLSPPCARTRLVEFYKGADVLLHPSFTEGSALVTYEAMACGLPVIATKAAGSVMRDGVEGFEVRSGDSRALAGYLERLYVDGKLRAEMGRGARVRVQEFDVVKYGARVVDVYKRYLGAK